MKTKLNLRRLPVFLLLLCVMTSYGQVMPSSPNTYYQPTNLGYATQQNSPAERKLSKTNRLPVITHEGAVVLTTGAQLWGLLSYQPLTNTLLLRYANSWRTYQADQLQHFSYTDRADDRLHYVTAFAVRLASGETRTLLLEELVPGAPIPLLQLPPPDSRHGTIIQGLPRPRAANWQTEQPYYVWFDGRLLVPDAFVRTEIDALLTTVPESVQYWAAAYPRPTCLLELARWLSEFERELARVQPEPVLVQPKPATTPSRTSSTLN